MGPKTMPADPEPAGTASDIRRKLLAGIPVTQRRLDLAGISTAVLDGGDGPPVVLLHGPAGYAAHWLRVIPELAADHRVVAPDLPDHGATQVLAGELDPDRILDWLGQVIARTCPTPPVLVGHLIGGAIAARFAVQRANELARLILVNTFGLVPFAPAPDFGAALQAYLTQPSDDTHEQFWQYCSFDLDRLRGKLRAQWGSLQAYNLDRLRSQRVQAATGSLMATFGFPAIPSADLADIAVPTTLIWGRHDRATPLNVAETASATYGWPLHVIDDAADDPAIDQPEAFLRAVRASLRNPEEES